MSKSTPILIIGFGSIGQRHYRNLSATGFRNIYVYDADFKKIKNQKSKIKNLNQETLKRFDVVFVCSPNHLHIEQALLAAKAGCHLFIEKPLSHNLKGINKLIRLCRRKKLVNMVACNMRFHPCLKFIKKYLEKRKLGRIYSIAHECGHYLPYWRPNGDYRKNYAAKRATGGGIILDDMHEFDLLFWLNNFESAVKSSLIFDKVSKLEIETEDLAVASFEFKNKVIGSVRCDYLQKRYSRNCKIVGEKGNLVWDYQENIVWLETANKRKKLLEVKNYDNNEFYLEEMKYFFSCIAKRQKVFNDIVRAKETLSTVLSRA